MSIRSKGVKEKGKWSSFYNASRQKLNYADFFRRMVGFLEGGSFSLKAPVEKTLKFYVVLPAYWREPTLEFKFQYLSKGSTTEQLANKESKLVAIARTLERLGVANITLKAGIEEDKIKELFDFLEKKEASLAALKERFSMPEIEVRLKNEVPKGGVKNLRSLPALVLKKPEIISPPVKGPESLRIEPLKEIKKPEPGLEAAAPEELRTEGRKISKALWQGNRPDETQIKKWINNVERTLEAFAYEVQEFGWSQELVMRQDLISDLFVMRNKLCDRLKLKKNEIVIPWARKSTKGFKGLPKHHRLAAKKE